MRPEYAPSKITFSGIDENVDVDALLELSKLYNFEVGILISPDRYGTPRYPSKGWIIDFIRRVKEYKEKLMDERETSDAAGSYRSMELAVHLCGDYVTGLLEDGYFGEEDLITEITDVQVNLGRAPTQAEAEVLRLWKEFYVKDVILQMPELPTEKLTLYRRVTSILLDASRGNGTERITWPYVADYARDQALNFAFAGGIGPHNVVRVCDQIIRSNSGMRYWIDMETNIRNSADQFDLEMIEDVLIQVQRQCCMDANGYVIEVRDLGSTAQETQIKTNAHNRALAITQRRQERERMKFSRLLTTT